MTARSVPEEPEVSVEGWAIVIDIFGDPRIVGRPAGTTRGRISSAVEAFDLHNMTATTASGRKYRLIGRGDWQNAALILVAMQRRREDFQGWISAEALALALAPTPGGMN